MKSHCMCGTREYRIWQNMKARCNRPGATSYHRYGGRGIRVCKRWDSFENFYADMGQSNGLSLDRIDNNGDYEPGNCQWIDQKEQAKKTCRIRYLTKNGETHSIAEWSRLLGIKKTTITMRLNAYGWTVDRALTP